MKTNNSTTKNNNKSLGQEKISWPVSKEQKHEIITPFFNQKTLGDNICQNNQNLPTNHQQRIDKINQILEKITKIEELPKPFITKKDIYQAKKLEELLIESEINREDGIILNQSKKILNNADEYFNLIRKTNQQIQKAAASRPDGPHPDFLILCNIPAKIADDFHEFHLYCLQTYCFIKNKISIFLNNASKRWDLLFCQLPKLNRKMTLANNFLKNNNYNLSKIYKTELPSSIMEIARQEYVKQAWNIRPHQIIKQFDLKNKEPNINKLPINNQLADLIITSKFNQARKIMNFKKPEFIKLLLKAIRSDKNLELIELLDQIIANKESFTSSPKKNPLRK